MSKRYEIKFNIYTDIELNADDFDDALERANEWFRDEYMGTSMFDLDIEVSELPTFNKGE